MQSSVVILKPGRERSVIRRHPWIFSGAVARVEGTPANGDIVRVRDSRGNELALGYVNQHSQITIRLLTWDVTQAIDRAFWQHHLQQAIAGRQALLQDLATTAFRLIHAESDGLPGLVVDRYGDYLAIQFLTIGMERRRDEIVEVLAELLSPKGIFERSDVDARKQEGLSPRTGCLWGSPPPQPLEIQENGRRFWVDIQAGQKTGFYLDQRENRARLPDYCRDADVLDGFAYTGACGIYALHGKAARVTFVEASHTALDVARRNLLLNDADPQDHEFLAGNVFHVLRDLKAEGRTFDTIVLDPPKFAPTGRSVQRATRAYKDINLLALQLLRPGGVLFSVSCSGAVSADLFQKVLFGAALDAGRETQIIGHLHQGTDHPVALTFPQGMYLKGLICRVG